MKLWLIGQDSSKNSGKQNRLGVSDNGEALVRAFKYSDLSFQDINVVDTAFNFFLPQGDGFQFVPKGALVSGNRDIGVNGSILVIYSATTEASTTVVDTILQAEVPKSSVFPFVVPDVVTTKNHFINGKCDDNSVLVTLYGFFVPTVS